MAEGAVAAMEQLQVAEDNWRAPRVLERKPYFERRVELFNQYKQRQQEAIEAAKVANVPINVVLPDGAGGNSRRAPECCLQTCPRLLAVSTDGRAASTYQCAATKPTGPLLPDASPPPPQCAPASRASPRPWTSPTPSPRA